MVMGDSQVARRESKSSTKYAYAARPDDKGYIGIVEGQE